MQHRLITELAEKEDCVIVGRCADAILKDKADCLRVFIYADMEYRAAYYRFYTDMKWVYAPNYHISLDSSKWGLEKYVDIILGLYRFGGLS